jgi:hypothetical protein
MERGKVSYASALMVRPNRCVRQGCVRGNILSISFRASAVRFASAIKATIRWPLSSHAKDGATVSKWNVKNVETKIAVNRIREAGIKIVLR